MNDDAVWWVRVDWCHTRPPTPGNTWSSTVTVAARDATEAALVAAQMVATRPACVMPTATTVLRCEV